MYLTVELFAIDFTIVVVLSVVGAVLAGCIWALRGENYRP